MFLRIVKQSAHIHNHKQNKVGLRKEGVDLDLLGQFEEGGGEDVILWLKPGGEGYVEFGKGDWEGFSRCRERQVELEGNEGCRQ